MSQSEKWIPGVRKIAVLRANALGDYILAQPALADAGEGEPAVMAQDSQVPPVFGDLSARVGEGPPEVGRQRVDQRPPHRLVLDGQLRQ